MTASNRPLIALSGTFIDSPGRSFFRTTPGLYIDAVWAAGGLPVLALSVGHEALAQSAAGLLLTGGVDLAPERFGEVPLGDEVLIDPERDTYELSLIEAFAAAKKPIFGICRGLQALNVAFGGSLWQDLPAQCGLHHGGGVTHDICLGESRYLDGLFPESFSVNSYHHQAVRIPASGFHVTALSRDGVVEAMEHDHLPIFAVQWHPERMIPAAWKDAESTLPDQSPLFSRFLALCMS